jgi:hypothetical protein
MAGFSPRSGATTGGTYDFSLGRPAREAPERDISPVIVSTSSSVVTSRRGRDTDPTPPWAQAAGASAATDLANNESRQLRFVCDLPDCSE